MNSEREVAAIALLAEPARRRLLDYVHDQPVPVGREEAARAVGISVRLAAFHLDRLASAGLLDVEFRRLSGRTGPGAGRPSKLYRPSAARVAVAMPETGHSLAASIMATALSAPHNGRDGATAVAGVARDVGRRIGEEIRSQSRSRRARRAAVERHLADLGFRPRRDRAKELVLGNCIFAELTESHRDLVCGMNLALVGGVLEGAELPALRAEGDSWERTCCVRVRG